MTINDRLVVQHGTQDIGALIDAGRWTSMQTFVVFLAASTILLDGFDSQLIGFAIPVLIREWGVARTDFSAVVAAGLIGMAIGSAVAGVVSDRFGRRAAVLGSVFVFATATAAIALANDLLTIAALRFVAGFGLGGALPSATTMAGEYTPLRIRTLAITAAITCVPAGGMLAGLFAGVVLPDYGWRALFSIGGALPFVLWIVLFFALPESPRWLARRPARWPDLVRLLRRMEHMLADTSIFVDVAEQRHEGRAGIGALFTDGRATSTIPMWIAFFLCLLCVYTAFSWLPTMLAAEGLSVAVSGQGLTAYNFGGVIGSLLCALAINRFGSRWPLIVCAGAGAASAFALRTVDPLQDAMPLIIGLGVHGLFVSAVQSTLYAVSANLYPTAVRATGIASALSFGRMGAILSAFVGAAVITMGGSDLLLGLLGIAMIGTTIALAVLRRHIPARHGQS